MRHAAVVEREMAGLRWLIISGPGDEVFRTLGIVAAEDIAAVLDCMPERAGLASYVRAGVGRARLAAVTDATIRDHPNPFRELRELSAGAGAPFEELLLLNLRGDLGVEDGTGCTDLAWRAARGYLAHNEDGAPGLAQHLSVLTIRVDGQPAVTVHWYPGFVPANTVVATEAGLVWGVNHIQVRVPATAAGRHFVARDLQRETTFAGACGYLSSNPSAGGFAYIIGDVATGDIAVIETAAARHTQRTLTDDGALHWHTNHLRYLDPEIDTPPPASQPCDRATDRLGSHSESITRGAATDALGSPTEPVAPWLAEALSGPRSAGIHRNASGGDPLMTLTTTITDLAAAAITVHSHHGTTRTLPLSTYLARTT